MNEDKILPNNISIEMSKQESYRRVSTFEEKATEYNSLQSPETNKRTPIRKPGEAPLNRPGNLRFTELVGKAVVLDHSV